MLETAKVFNWRVGMQKYESLHTISGGERQSGGVAHIESGSLDSLFLLDGRRMMHFFNKNAITSSESIEESEAAYNNEITQGIQNNGVLWVAMFLDRTDMSYYSYVLGTIALV